MEPLVTVGLPIYNAEAYLAECIESIKAQTLKEFTVLAVLDCPTDNSASVLRKHADSRFHIVENESNLGLTATGNRMLDLCQTDFLARMDHDDIMFPERLQRQYDYLTSHPEIDVLGTYFDLIDKNGKVVAKPHKFGLTPEEIREEFRLTPALHHPTVMYRVASLRAIGGYFSQYSEDSSLWLKGLVLGLKYANLPDCLLHYRIHTSQTLSTQREQWLSALDAAYAEFGPQIWGDRAPDFVSGGTRAERLKRRIKRKLSSLFS